MLNDQDRERLIDMFVPGWKIVDYRFLGVVPGQGWRTASPRYWIKQEHDRASFRPSGG